MNEEEAAFQPLERRLPTDLCIRGEIPSCQIPCANHEFQSSERGVGSDLFFHLIFFLSLDPTIREMSNSGPLHSYVSHMVIP